MRLPRRGNPTHLPLLSLFFSRPILVCDRIAVCSQTGMSAPHCAGVHGCEPHLRHQNMDGTREAFELEFAIVCQRDGFSVELKKEGLVAVNRKFAD